MKINIWLAFCLIITILALQIQPEQSSQVLQLTNIPKNNYPVRVGFVQKITQCSPPQRLAASLGVPGYTDQKIYNYILLGSWKCDDDATNAALAWSKPVHSFGDNSIFGKTKDEIQQNLKKKYNDAKTQVLINAFGNAEMPTSFGLSATECAGKLATFVLANNLDGCNVDWQDETSLLKGTGYDWLLTFQTQLRNLLPNHIITHSPQPSFFISQNYGNRSYTELNQKLNKTINFYNVRFFNQGTSKYDTCDGLFVKSTGSYLKSSVSEIVERGLDLKKVVVVKPTNPSYTIGSGYMDLDLLGECAAKAFTDMKWFAGVGMWQYSGDIRGKAMSTSISKLKQFCTANKDCK